MNTRDSLGDRMKRYERVSDHYLTRRVPVILCLDGKAFHTFIKNMEKPFDYSFMRAMWTTALNLTQEIQGYKFAYVQSDEISILLTDYDKLDTEPWFGYRLNKMCSVGASLASTHFNKLMGSNIQFDARAFNLGKEEVCNYFIWRQQDATRNSVQMVAQANFPHKSLQNLNSSQLQEKLFQEKGINWNDLPCFKKRGIGILKTNIEEIWLADMETPIFSQDRNYIEWRLESKEDDNIREKDTPGES